MAPTLPAGWSDLLDAIRQRIDDIIAATDARLQQTPPLEAPAPWRQCQDELAGTQERMHGLGERLQSAERVIAAADALLAAEEARLSQAHQASRSLPQKLAAWGQRAIG